MKILGASVVEGDRGREPGIPGDRRGMRGTGGRRRKSGKRDTQFVGNHEKLRKILQHFIIICNGNRTRGTGTLQREVGDGGWGWGWGPGVKKYGKMTHSGYRVITSFDATFVLA